MTEPTIVISAHLVPREHARSSPPASSYSHPTQEAPTMSRPLLHLPHRPGNDVPDEFDPGSAPTEPDEGPVPDPVPEDPEHERVRDPVQVQSAQTTRALKC